MACFVWEGKLTLMCDKCGSTVFTIKYHPTEGDYDQKDGFSTLCYKCQGKNW